MILLYVILGGGESLVAGDITVQEVVGIAGVESIFAQGEHVVEGVVGEEEVVGEE